MQITEMRVPHRLIWHRGQANMQHHCNVMVAVWQITLPGGTAPTPFSHIHTPTPPRDQKTWACAFVPARWRDSQRWGRSARVCLIGGVAGKSGQLYIRAKQIWRLYGRNTLPLDFSLPIVMFTPGKQGQHASGVHTLPHASWLLEGPSLVYHIVLSVPLAAAAGTRIRG